MLTCGDWLYLSVYCIQFGMCTFSQSLGYLIQPDSCKVTVALLAQISQSVTANAFGISYRCTLISLFDRKMAPVFNTPLINCFMFVFRLAVWKNGEWETCSESHFQEASLDDGVI
jgi:hypothetical protein